MKIEIPFSGTICLDVEDSDAAMSTEKSVIEAMRWAKQISEEVDQNEQSNPIFYIKILIDYHHPYVLKLGSEDEEKQKAILEQTANIKPFAKKI